MTLKNSIKKKLTTAAELFNSFRFELKNYFQSIIFIIVIALFTLILSIYFNFFGAFEYFKFNKSFTELGTFGDFIGGTLNPALGLVSVFLLQRTFQLQQKMAQDSENFIQKQTKTQNKQNFENTFFSLVDQLSRLKDSLNYDNMSSDIYFSSKTKDIFDSTGITNNVQAARNIISNENEKLGHYFRMLYQTLKFIATNCPDSTLFGKEFTSDNITSNDICPQEKSYSNIIRSMLSYHLTQLLAINCYCEQGASSSYWKFKLLVERYSFLEHMPFHFNKSLFYPLINLKNHYNKSAFGHSEFLKNIDKDSYLNNNQSVYSKSNHVDYILTKLTGPWESKKPINIIEINKDLIFSTIILSTNHKLYIEFRNDGITHTSHKKFDFNADTPNTLHIEIDFTNQLEYHCSLTLTNIEHNKFTLFINDILNTKAYPMYIFSRLHNI